MIAALSVSETGGHFPTVGPQIQEVKFTFRLKTWSQPDVSDRTMVKKTYKNKKQYWLLTSVIILQLLQGPIWVKS